MDGLSCMRLSRPQLATYLLGKFSVEKCTPPSNTDPVTHSLHAGCDANQPHPAHAPTCPHLRFSTLQNGVQQHFKNTPFEFVRSQETPFACVDSRAEYSILVSGCSVASGFRVWVFDVEV